MKYITFCFIFLILLFTMTSFAESISYQELYHLFDSVVETIDPDLISDWSSQNQTARNAKEPLTRSNAMVAVFNLAEFLGPGYFCFNCMDTIDWEYSPWDNDDWHVNNYWGDPLRFPVGFNGKTENDGSNYGGNAYFYSMGRVSLLSGEPIFDKGRCSDLLSKEEAKKMTKRFFESGMKSSERVPTAIDEEILKKAQIRRMQIISSPTTIVPAGKTYYVSTEGKDSNSGLSPEKAWKTLTKVSNANLKKGDVVFFKRGDIWRGESLRIQAGVTYSAYGTGAKPMFLGSPENGASPEKWSLLPGTTNIWVFYKELIECGYIVLDEGISARRVAPYLEGDVYTMPDGSGMPFDVSAALTQNLMFFSNDDTFKRHIDVYQTFKNPGKLYLRCDEGNPGEVFKSIEFCTWVNVKSYNKGIIYTSGKSFREVATVDNICLKYTGVYGCNLGGCSVTVQNCEIGWCGGCYTDYLDDNVLIAFGNCVGSYGEIDGYKVNNCCKRKVPQIEWHDKKATNAVHTTAFIT